MSEPDKSAETSSNQILLDSFTTYCKEHPNEGFWPALRNWSGQDYVLFGNLSSRRGGKEFATIGGIKVYVHDTFNLYGKE